VRRPCFINNISWLSLIPGVNIEQIDLNLLRLFDAVYRTRSVSRAADLLDISQPAASNRLTRLRLLLGDPLFARAHGGVRPTPAADRLASAVRTALALIADALGESTRFEAAGSRRLFRLHMSDLSEARFLPALMTALNVRAPGVRIECHALPHARIAPMLDSAEIDFAFGFLPSVGDTERMALADDRYVVMLREGHRWGAARGRRAPALSDLAKLDYVAVRSHSETLRILELMNLQDRVRLWASHFLALPTIVRASELALVMPRHIARGFAAEGGYAVIEPRLPLRDFTVSLHWSKRRESDPAHRWMRGLIEELFVIH
jgi:DNA-binding transcriptional LysR family regulator